MKKHMKALFILYSLLGDHVYSYEATKYNVTCMCHFSSEVLKKAHEYKFKLTTTSLANGYIRLTRGDYTIILTE
jgi:hypothetical protein